MGAYLSDDVPIVVVANVQRDARLIQLLLVYLPVAGENEIDETMSRLHALTDAVPGALSVRRSRR